MENLYIYKDTTTELMYPRFRLRCLVALLFSFTAFWYSGFFGANFNALFSQNFAIQKLLFFLLGGLIIEEWSFDVTRFIKRKYPKGVYQNSVLLKLCFLLIILPCTFMYMLPTLFNNIYNQPMYFELPRAVFINNSLMIMIISASHLLVNAAQNTVFKLIAMKDENGKTTFVKQTDIAYIFCVEESYFITLHNGTHYDCKIAMSLAKFSKNFDPQSFFPINEYTLVSRKACKKVTENTDGTLKVSLHPKPILPKELSERMGVSKFE